MRRDSSFLCISITIKNGGKILGKNLSGSLYNEIAHLKNRIKNSPL